MWREVPAPGDQTSGTATTTQPSATATTGAAGQAAIAGASTVSPGTYQVNTTESSFNWAAKKPLIEGYVNSGSVGVSKGSITVGADSASGDFTIDMNTLKVGLTTKAGMEGALEKHLKSADFFEVSKYPTASVTIKGVTSRADSATTFTYDVRAALTMKGVTNDVSFPAQIYQKDGALHAHASFEIDRTKWNIRFGSGSFFQDLGNNLIADQVAISLKIVAR